MKRDIIKLAGLDNYPKDDIQVCLLFGGVYDGVLIELPKGCPEIIIGPKAPFSENSQLHVAGFRYVKPAPDALCLLRDFP